MANLPQPFPDKPLQLSAPKRVKNRPRDQRRAQAKPQHIDDSPDMRSVPSADPEPQPTQPARDLKRKWNGSLYIRMPCFTRDFYRLPTYCVLLDVKKCYPSVQHLTLLVWVYQLTGAAATNATIQTFMGL